jgi:FtsP/CotA-like multicopper oxidase with cupredoxin domain
MAYGLTRLSALAGISAVLLAPSAFAQDSSISVQCPTSTDLHPSGDGITCINLVAGDGMVTMGDDDDGFGNPGGKRLYIFSFAEAPVPDVGAGDPAINSPGYAGWLMDQGTMAANSPAPTLSVDEDDEVFLTLSNVGMAMRPDLFDPHTVHWHGFPQAASIFDGIPDASVSVNMGASLSYYYNAKDAGTYMYHCHVEATEHMQMGMLGNLYVRPRQNRCLDLTDDLAVPGSTCPTGHVDGDMYAYNDGDASTYYDVEYPIQIGSFDPAFHDASFYVQPLPFAGMRDSYFLLNGRGYPSTVDAGLISTEDPYGISRPSQPVSSLITADPGDRILLRISNLNVTQFSTLATNGLPMEVIALDARMLRDGDGNNMYYKTNSVTLGGGQSVDVVIDTSGLTSGEKYFLYTTNLHQLANDDENFGGMMTEIHIN